MKIARSLLPAVFATVALSAHICCAELKPRVVILTDLKRVQEVDDTQSMLRLLSHADLVEIEGIIVNSGFNYWKPEHGISGYEYLFELIGAYERSVGNLMKMPGQRGFEPVESVQNVGYWPSPNYLRQRSALGFSIRGLDQTGPGKGNDGSRLIASIVDEPDARPVYVLAWGGANVLTQTLRDLTENPLLKRSPEAVAAFIKKIRVIAIADQDQPSGHSKEAPLPNNAGLWTRTHFPELFWVWIDGGEIIRAMNSGEDFYHREIQGHSALGEAYPDHHYAVEGDTPALFYMLPLGVGDPEHPQWGCLSGFFPRGKHEPGLEEVFTNCIRDRDDVKQRCQEMYESFLPALWNLFAARLDWARAGTGNRQPKAALNGDMSSRIIEVKADAGSTVTLDASQSRDEESDILSYRWKIISLPIPELYAGEVKLSVTDSARTAVEVPGDAAGKDVHVLLTVTDQGAGHPLSAWRRAIIHVMGDQDDKRDKQKQ